MAYQYRQLEPLLAQYAEAFPLVGLKGPIGAGKTTLLVNQFPSHDYVNFDDSRTILRYREDPTRFLRQLNKQAILDEVQHVPDLINALTGSATPQHRYILASSCLYKPIRHLDRAALSRMKMLTLLPFQRQEIPNQLREESIYRGGFPQLISQQYNGFDDWFTNYLQTQISSLLPSVGNISDHQAFQHLLHLLASHTAEPLNLSRYAHLLSVDVKTIKRWIEILAACFVIFLMPAYHDNFGKRITKSPKLYFYDTGLVAYLTGIETKRQFEFGPLANAMYENYVVMEILKKTLYEEKPSKFYYLRTNHGVGIDLIIETQGKRQLICIQNNETFRIRMIEPLESFRRENDACYLVYNGADLPYGEHIQVKSVSTYLHAM